MPNYNKSTRSRVADIKLGLRLDRAAAVTANATTPFFTVVGDILLTGLFLKVTAAAGGANTISWSVNPTDGTTKSISGNLDIDPALVGDLIGWPGVLATALTYGGAVLGLSQPLFITAGTIDLVASAADGTVSATLFYVPASEGAYVEVA